MPCEPTPCQFRAQINTLLEWLSDCLRHMLNRFRLRAKKPLIWTVRELHEWTCALSDEHLLELTDCHINVVTKMIELLPETGTYEEDRALLHWLLGQLKSFPSARICTMATLECERIKESGVFDEYLCAHGGKVAKRQGEKR